MTTITESETLQSASGNHGGKIINGITKLSDSSKMANINSVTYNDGYTIYDSTAYFKYAIIGKILVSPYGGGRVIGGFNYTKTGG